MAAIQSPRIRKVITIASGLSISAAVDQEGYRIAALDMSSGWDAANRMTFRGAASGASTFYDLYNASGVELSIASGAPLTSTTGRGLCFAAALTDALAAPRYVKIQSGPSSAPVNLTTGVTVGVLLLPL